MATVEAVVGGERSLVRAFGPILVVLGSLILFHFLDLGTNASLQTFVVVFTAIAVEALPFVLLGAFMSALLEVYVPERFFTAVGRLPAALQLPAAALGGFAFPVCECGSVPVARRLIARGVHPSAGLAFMVASPIFNPIVLGSTWIAYRALGLGLPMVAGRAALGLILALVVGWTLGADGARELLRSKAGDGQSSHDCCTAQPRRSAFAMHLTNDFFFMGRFLLLGASLAAAVQALVPQNVVAGAVSSPLLAIGALMLLAFVSSLCSEADAFVAVSFVSFPLGSQLAFLVFGPVLDFKLLFLYGAAFRRRFVNALAGVAIATCVAGALWFEVLMR